MLYLMLIFTPMLKAMDSQSLNLRGRDYPCWVTYVSCPTWVSQSLLSSLYHLIFGSNSWLLCLSSPAAPSFPASHPHPPPVHPGPAVPSPSCLRCTSLHPTHFQLALSLLPVSNADFLCSRALGPVLSPLPVSSHPSSSASPFFWFAVLFGPILHTLSPWPSCFPPTYMCIYRVCICWLHEKCWPAY